MNKANIARSNTGCPCSVSAVISVTHETLVCTSIVFWTVSIHHHSSPRLNKTAMIQKISAEKPRWQVPPVTATYISRLRHRHHLPRLMPYTRGTLD
ncbi:uncharacterized protein MYCFIDRAFT_169288 [Pseudocercospora fijiensis CIRAD86]|uniref:Uncharacterized protein n=1 Tax=Pseudocercospora fijiensis (strain CIRAD86) TaxID=383855 RepID=N1Q7B1_PSEFD|nr:uncharacterized protein MYCFIDRAFT_169288 [Pseudocercospora fijiensis CIRAD86]EME87471.1 hypothetical protein MYCFIDRAFT_169288 [Pseudocercospora fijiensis CIRAD86]